MIDEVELQLHSPSSQEPSLATADPLEISALSLIPLEKLPSSWMGPSSFEVRSLPSSFSSCSSFRQAGDDNSMSVARSVPAASRPKLLSDVAEDELESAFAVIESESCSQTAGT